ncbi:MAG: M12 family metallo-peptidase [Planctomycetota bacterium]|nr:M12 family metallo-peptidase [Planctomycetota bacterium]
MSTWISRNFPARCARVFGVRVAACLAGVLCLASGSAVAPAQASDPIAAERVSQEGLWMLQPGLTPEAARGRAWIRPEIAQHATLDFAGMVAYLVAAPLEGTPAERRAPLILTLPRPDGTFERFLVAESPIMEPALAAQLPGTKTFVAQGLDNPAAVARLDHTDAGFHAMVLAQDGSYFIDPVSRDDVTHYASYFVRDYKADHDFRCLVTNQGGAPTIGFDGPRQVRTGPIRREYALAVAATGEYTAFHGGTVTAGQNAIVTAINRVNTVYEVDLAVRLILVGNNNLLVFTNAATDPYENNNPGQMLNANTTQINNRIGSANYDIGHVFSTGGGGIAGLGVVCGGSKGAGVTGTSSPVGDPFVIDYVAHEMGHQFRANHSFNGTGGSCGSNRNGSTAMEPGSGTTIMSYAGICGSDDVQSNSNAYFHSISFDEILSFISGTTCDTEVSTGNTAPTVLPPAARTIPRRTPIFLSGVATDPGGSASLSYCWEERELGASQTLAATDNGTSPNFRSFSPVVADGTRFVPRLSSVLTNTLAVGEKWYDVARTVTWRLTARDNTAGGGGVNTGDVTLTVDPNSGPFTVSTPLANATWVPGTTQTVTWNVANTNVAPVSVNTIQIQLSTDGGNTFPTVLNSGDFNDGSAQVTVPAINTTTARIRVVAVGNYFYNVNPGNFRISGDVPPPPTNVGAAPGSICQGQTTTLSASVVPGDFCDWYSGSCGGTLVGTGTSIVVTPASTTTYFARSRRGGIFSDTCGQVTVTVNPVAVAPTSATVSRSNFCASDSGTITLTAVGGSGTTARWFTGSCGSASIATGPNITIASPSVSTTYFVRWETACGVTACASVSVPVRQAPTIGTQPQNQTVDAGDPATFSVVAGGSPTLSYQWQKNTVDILGATASSYSIASAQESDEGQYRVIVTNPCGIATSFAATLTVNAPSCPADFNQDGIFDFFDYLDFASAYSSEDASADINGDTIVDFFDYLDYAALYDAGCA